MHMDSSEWSFQVSLDDMNEKPQMQFRGLGISNRHERQYFFLILPTAVQNERILQYSVRI